MQQLLSRKLGDNIVTVTNNVLHTFLKIFAVVKFLPCFSIIADTGKLIKKIRITKGTFLHEFCLGASTFSYTLTWACVLDCSTLLYLIRNCANVYSPCRRNRPIIAHIFLLRFVILPRSKCSKSHNFAPICILFVHVLMWYD